MALEQQNNPIIDKTTQQRASLREKPSSLAASQLELIPTDGSMSVSFYHIPYMSSAVEQQRVRQALIPFTELLLEHSIDVDARHLALYHHVPIDQVTAALQNLHLGAELQQTMPHFEPLELATAKPEAIEKRYHEQGHSLLASIQQFVSVAVMRFRQWLKALKDKQDR